MATGLAWKMQTGVKFSSAMKHFGNASFEEQDFLFTACSLYPLSPKPLFRSSDL